jgi:hypothetical protein
MSNIDEQIAALEEAIATGVRKVVTQTNGVRKEVEYPSFADMKARLNWLYRKKNGGRPGVTLATFGRGRP